MLRKTFGVLVHGMRITIDLSCQKRTIARMQEENKNLHQGLEILWVAWPIKVTGSGKSHSSMIVEVASEAMANHILDHGLIDGHSECSCELFSRECRMTQCFKCHLFEHVAKIYCNDLFCHKCEEKHQTDRCEMMMKCRHCTECKKKSHKS